MSPTQRAMAELKKIGATAAIVEKWNQYARIRQDLFGFADILFVHGTRTVFLQVAHGSDHKKRVDKILAEPRAVPVLEANNHIEVWTYTKRGPRGKRKVWTARKQAITLEDFHVGQRSK